MVEQESAFEKKKAFSLTLRVFVIMSEEERGGSPTASPTTVRTQKVKCLVFRGKGFFRGKTARWSSDSPIAGAGFGSLHS